MSKEDIGTHIVWKIEYGKEVYFNFRLDVDKNTNKEDLDGKVGVVLDTLKKLGGTGEVHGSVKKNDEEKQIRENLRCEYSVSTHKIL